MYSNEKVGYGSGAMDNFLTELAEAVERDLREATSELETLRQPCDTCPVGHASTEPHRVAYVPPSSEAWKSSAGCGDARA